MNRAQQLAFDSRSARPSSSPSVVHRILRHCFYLLFAAIAFAAYEHFKLQGQSTPALVSLIAAGLFALAPVCALLGALLGIERRTQHLLHGVGALGFVGLSLGGVVSGAPLVQHAAMAPFAIMGAAQALMHQDHPRNAQQAAALRRFATSLPEVAQFTSSRDLTSPANAARAVSVLTDLVGKAQALGETELQSDPGFQSALSRVTTRFGLTLGLDTIDQAVQKLAANPAAASAIPGLRNRLAAARRTIAAGR